MICVWELKLGQQILRRLISDTSEQSGGTYICYSIRVTNLHFLMCDQTLEYRWTLKIFVPMMFCQLSSRFCCFTKRSLIFFEGGREGRTYLVIIGGRGSDFKPKCPIFLCPKVPREGGCPARMGQCSIFCFQVGTALPQHLAFYVRMCLWCAPQVLKKTSKGIVRHLKTLIDKYTVHVVTSVDINLEYSYVSRQSIIVNNRGDGQSTLEQQTSIVVGMDSQ